MELRTAWDCQRWNILPESGGYYDQDYILLLRMASFANVYSVLNKMRSMKGAQIHNLTEADRKVLKVLKDEGLIFQ